MSFYCTKCKQVRKSDELAARMPGIGQVCIPCLNEQVETPENRMVGSDEMARRALKMLPSEKLAKRSRMRLRKMSVSLTGTPPPRCCSRPGVFALSAAGASV